MNGQQVKMTMRVAGAAPAANAPADTSAAHALLSLSAPDTSTTPVQRQQQQLAKLIDIEGGAQDVSKQVWGWVGGWVGSGAHGMVSSRYIVYPHIAGHESCCFPTTLQDDDGRDAPPPPPAATGSTSALAPTRRRHVVVRPYRPFGRPATRSRTPLAGVPVGAVFA